VASQVAHIIYANEYLKKNSSARIDRGSFFLGCTFPDIRRIEPKIKRNETHPILEDLNLEIRYLESFQAGWKYHLYCDMRREEILNDSGFYKISGTAELWGLPNKMLEDEVVYDFFKDWDAIVGYFNNAPVVETNIGVSRETFRVWYAMLAKYFENKPDSDSIRIFIKKQPKLKSMADDIVSHVDKLIKNDKVVETLRGVKDGIVTGNQ
jgi:hypothetical protein